MSEYADNKYATDRQALQDAGELITPRELDGKCLENLLARLHQYFEDRGKKSGDPLGWMELSRILLHGHHMDINRAELHNYFNRVSPNGQVSILIKLCQILGIRPESLLPDPDAKGGQPVEIGNISLSEYVIEQSVMYRERNNIYAELRERAKREIYIVGVGFTGFVQSQDLLSLKIKKNVEMKLLGYDITKLTEAEENFFDELLCEPGYSSRVRESREILDGKVYRTYQRGTGRIETRYYPFFLPFNIHLIDPDTEDGAAALGLIFPFTKLPLAEVMGYNSKTQENSAKERPRPIFSVTRESQPGLFNALRGFVKALWDRYEPKPESKKSGKAFERQSAGELKKAEEKVKLDVAKAMQAEGLSIEVIRRCTGLTKI
jgi:hypothetical protein